MVSGLSKLGAGKECESKAVCASERVWKFYISENIRFLTHSVKFSDKDLFC